MRILVKSREALQKLSGEDGVIAVVSISDDPDDFPAVPPSCDCHSVLRLHFDDIEINFNVDEPSWWADEKFRTLAAFTVDQARDVAAFVLGLPSHIDSLVFQCEAGVSRSAGMAAAVSRRLGKDDMQFFRRYLPNRLVYRLILEQTNPNNYVQASCEAICDKCGQPYAKHSIHPVFPWLTALCDGRNVKL